MKNEIPIGQLCELINGRAFKPSDWSDAGLPIVRIQNLNDHDATFNYYNGPVRERFLIEDGELLFSWSGTPGTSFGAFFWNRGPAILNQHIFRVLVNDKIEKSYFRYALNARIGSITAQAHGGVGLQHITKEKLEATPVPVPSLPEQRRTAALLDQADSIRRKRRGALVLAESFLRSAFLEVVGPQHPDHNAWPLATVAWMAADRENAMRTGPFGSDLLHSEFVDEGIPVIGIDNAVRNRFAWDERRYITQAKYEKLRRYTLHPGDVIVTIMGTVGRTAVVPDDIPTAINSKHLAAITVDRAKALPEYLAFALRLHPDVQRQIAAKSRGAIMSGLNLGVIKSLQLRVPPLAVQQQFARVVERQAVLVARLERGVAEAERMFGALVGEVFGGKPTSRNSEHPG